MYELPPSMTVDSKRQHVRGQAGSTCVTANFDDGVGRSGCVTTTHPEWDPDDPLNHIPQRRPLRHNSIGLLKFR
jgi:hypothetical protein